VARHVCFVVNSRANYARIKSTIAAAQERDDLQISIILGASALLYKYGNVADLIKRDGFEVSAEVYTIVDGDKPVTMAKTTALSILELSSQFDRLKPDVVLTVADRYETLGTAIAASYMNIPLAHTQGGEITGSIDESVRHACTKLAHLHFPASQSAAKVLEQLGENPKHIYVTGCPSIDIAKNTKKEELGDILQRYSGVGPPIDASRAFLLVSQHPVTTEFLDAKSQILETLKAIEEMGTQTIWLWPNVDSGSDAISKTLRTYREKTPNSKIHFYRNFSAEDYVNILRTTSCIIGNSSSGIRESSFLGTPAVNIGTRQDGRERGRNVIDVTYNKEKILSAIELQSNRGRVSPEFIYGDGSAGVKMVNVLAGSNFDINKKFFHL
jgi:UDP-hydrolysing UDP-N-acetyl-D-glucosamine 2-epimerase